MKYDTKTCLNLPPKLNTRLLLNALKLMFHDFISIPPSGEGTAVLNFMCMTALPFSPHFSF